MKQSEKLDVIAADDRADTISSFPQEPPTDVDFQYVIRYFWNFPNARLLYLYYIIGELA